MVVNYVLVSVLDCAASRKIEVCCKEHVVRSENFREQNERPLSQVQSRGTSEEEGLRNDAMSGGPTSPTKVGCKAASHVSEFSSIRRHSERETAALTFGQRRRLSISTA